MRTYCIHGSQCMIIFIPSIPNEIRVEEYWVEDVLVTKLLYHKQLKRRGEDLRYLISLLGPISYLPCQVNLQMDM